MGNANTHGSIVADRERRKSRGGGGGGHHSANPLLDQGHHRRNSSATRAGNSGAVGHHHHYDDVGPVEMTAAGVHASVRSGTAQATRMVAPHRPRATTLEAGATRRTRQISLDQSSIGPDSLIGSVSEVRGVHGGVTGGGSKKKSLPTIFKYTGNAKEVYVCGTFNNWEKLPMVKSTKDFATLVHLEEGDYEYKFYVDGQWLNDPASEDLVETEEGIRNNHLCVRKEDFNAFAALDMDSEAVMKAKASKNRSLICGSDDFGQEVPAPYGLSSRSGPPILPPHLLQVILNKDTPLSCEPTLLPEPNHVMLNHLYALSIKDGVMVLSSTNRYRKKYVTTLLYKPMGARKRD